MNIGKIWRRLNTWRKQRRVQTIFAISLALMAPLLVLFTYLVLRASNGSVSNDLIRFVLLLDFVYVLVVAALVGQRILRMMTARSKKTAGSRLHLRLSGVFAFVALVPTVLVAVISTILLNFGFENWFSTRVQDVVGNSLAAAQAYENEQRDDLVTDAQLLAQFLNQQKRVLGFAAESELRSSLTLGQQRIQRGLKEAYVIDGAANLKARGERSYLFDFEAPSENSLSQAEEGKTVVIQDWDNNEFRALIRLSSYPDRYVYVSRTVDGEILNLLDETKETVALYNQGEQERDQLLFDLALIYLGFALIVILAAIWLGLWFAERLARPVGRLAGAAQRVTAGDLNARVKEEPGDDEIAMLSRIFNRMTQQVKRQHDDLREANERTERRRRLFDSVLSGVTAGVIGLNSDGQIAMMNAAAARLLNLDIDADVDKELILAVPEFATLFSQLEGRKANVAQDEIRLTRADSPEILLVRMAVRTSEEGYLEGYVVTFDDVTSLVSAQRLAAWGDVARRIAHEIKNPLTPIQLSAERMKRKFGPKLGEDAADLEQYSDVIIRQTNDLRRIVDEFSKFARMPEPERRQEDLAQLIRDVVVLQQEALQPTQISLDMERTEIHASFDATMFNQAFTNLIKNAGEAIDGMEEKPADFTPEIRVSVVSHEGATHIEIQDNGMGLPAENRSRLFEPYVTHRDSGTGLGLPIVKKIIEEHGGTLELLDAPPFDETGRVGAMARIVLPFGNELGTVNENIKAAQ
ncbi:PAS domain-containing sensor histidine kinase [Amylibacter sp. IMCC11727]|uniref:sensor histidine kinase NtrY-like n=1 Tax=Amylibacter sp. IMCC11727 TaxID=3039851 RepID=UPI00244E2DE4|nr:PAS domain-containing sensor histidine kinase [Amylibacter sp. IMCC11727]WGI20347.1 PAS domain-containing sensor histidine kinase [Amylibacter sp. IMCC11727]